MKLYTSLIALSLCALGCSAANASNLQDRIVKEVVKAKTKGYVSKVESKLGITPQASNSSSGTAGSTATNLFNQVKTQLGNKATAGATNPAAPGSTTLTKTIINRVESHFKINPANTGTAAGVVPGAPVTTKTTTNTVIDKIESRLGINLPGGTNASAGAASGALPGSALPGATLSGATLPGASLSGASLSGATLPGASLSGTTLPGTTLPGTTLPGALTSKAAIKNAIIDKVESRLGIDLPGGSNAATTGGTNTSDLLKQVESKLGIKK